MKIQIISAALPPKLDGIGDYTARVGGGLAEMNAVTLITSSDEATDTVSGCDIKQLFDIADRKSIRNILPFIEQSRPDWILLQYQPFSYGRMGLNLALPRIMQQVKKISPGTKILLMAHEPFVQILDLKHALMTIWQRWQLRSLGKSADVIAFPIEVWARKFSAWFPAKPVVHLPVPSNISVHQGDRDRLRRQMDISQDTIVLGMFGQAHVSYLMDWIKPTAVAVATRGIKTKVLYIGPQPDRVRDALANVPLVTTGALCAEDVSRQLACIDIFLAPFVDGISTRRSSVMAALHHGLPVAGTTGYNTDRVLSDNNGRGLSLTDAASQAAYTTMVADIAEDPDRRSQLASSARELYDREFALDRLLVKITSLLTTGAMAGEKSRMREKAVSI